MRERQRFQVLQGSHSTSCMHAENGHNEMRRARANEHCAILIAGPIDCHDICWFVGKSRSS